MLQLYKNQVVTQVSKEQIDLRQLELDWYCSNYDTMAVSSTMLAGFAYDQLTNSVPAKTTSLQMEFVYVVFTAVSLGLALSIAVTCIFSVIFGKSLALRGSLGATSVNIAVDNLRNEQKVLYLQFVACLLCYLISHVLQVVILHPAKEDKLTSITHRMVLPPMIFFFLLIVYFTISLTVKLQVRDSDAISGTIAALRPYERIADLDQQVYEPLSARRHLHESQMAGAGNRDSESLTSILENIFAPKEEQNGPVQPQEEPGTATSSNSPKRRRDRNAVMPTDSGLGGGLSSGMASGGPGSRAANFASRPGEGSSGNMQAVMQRGREQTPDELRAEMYRKKSVRANYFYGGEQEEDDEDHHHDAAGVHGSSTFMSERGSLNVMFDPLGYGK
ncbi:unnamed protein product [Amoebophrya sp. A120]|nr:unnamed protein product [Amoebophrya sp. A120]|eukprot:GSA120T00015732001.1